MSILWKVDPAHTEIRFKVKHLMITTITGYFRKFSGEVRTETEEFNTTTDIRFTADIDSIDTNNPQRDTHLKSADFFDLEEHRQVVFTGTRYETLGSEATLHGDLTIRDTTRPILLNVEFGGLAVDGSGQTKAGFTVTGKISRKEFGLIWNAITEAGSVVVGDEIRIAAEVQLIRQQ